MGNINEGNIYMNPVLGKVIYRIYGRTIGRKQAGFSSESSYVDHDNTLQSLSSICSSVTLRSECQEKMSLAYSMQKQCSGVTYQSNI